MVNLVDLVRRQCIYLDLVAADQNQALAAVTRRMVAGGVLSTADQPELLRRLTERESLCSTAVGHGAAIPHCYYDKLTTPLIVIGRLSSPINYCSPDERQVDLIFLLLGPERVPAMHIQILSRIVRLLKDERFDEELRRADSPEAVLAALREVESRHH